MGKRGPKPIPTEELVKRGSWLAPARRKAGEPQLPAYASVNLPGAPRHLSTRAKAIWKSLGRKLAEKSILTDWDLNALSRYCHLQAKFEELAAADIDDDLKTLTNVNAALAKLDACFGLTPADRARVRVEKPEKPKAEDPAAKFMSKGNLKIAGV